MRFIKTQTQRVFKTFEKPLCFFSLRQLTCGKLFVKYRTIKITFCLMMAISLFHFYYEYIAIDEDEIIDTIHKNNLKAVQLLTGRFGSNRWESFRPHLGEYPFQHCPEKRCYAFKPFFFRQKPFETSDAILVHVPNLLYMPSKSNYKRNPNQLWAFYTLESQRRSFCSTHYKIEDLDDWFNITSTFKLKSTMIHDYKPFPSFNDLKNNARYLKGFVNFRKDDEEPSMAHFQRELDKKPKNASLALWFVSHCETPSKREEFAKDLSKHISIDIFGECSSEFKSSKTDPCKNIKDSTLSNECNIQMFNSYKFYLAFENSLCDEYVTEKYW